MRLELERKYSPAISPCHKFSGTSSFGLSKSELAKPNVPQPASKLKVHFTGGGRPVSFSWAPAWEAKRLLRAEHMSFESRMTVAALPAFDWASRSSDLRG